MQGSNQDLLQNDASCRVKYLTVATRSDPCFYHNYLHQPRIRFLQSIEIFLQHTIFCHKIYEDNKTISK